MKNFAFLLILLIKSFHSFAVQYVPQDSTQVINVSLSHSHHNRIGIIDDRIKRVFFKNNNISLEIEEITGQIFVQALRVPCPNTTISIVSSSGDIQELELSFIDSPSEVILLTKSLPCQEICLNDKVDDSFFSSIVNGFLNGQLPDGYQSIDDPEKPLMVKEGLKLQRLNRLVNQEQIIFVYRLTNVSKRPKRIVECEVNILDGDWVFLDRYDLKPQETALVLIGCLR